MSKKEWFSKWIGAFIFGTLLIIIYKTFDNFTTVFHSIGQIIGLFTPFIIGFVLAFFLYPGCRKVEKLYLKAKPDFIQKHARTFGVMSVYLLFLAAVVLAVAYLLPKISTSVTDFLRSIPQYMTEIRSFLTMLKEDGGLFENLDVDRIMTTINLDSLINNFFFNNLDAYVEGFRGVTSTLMNGFMGIVICAYTLLEKDRLFGLMRRLFMKIFKRAEFSGFSAYVHKISGIFYDFFYGKAIESLIVAVIGTIGFYLLGVPYAFLMGIILLVFNMIPYFGPIIGAVPVVAVTLIANGPFPALWVTLFILILQQFDGIYLGPRVLGNSVGVSPFWIIFAILIGGGLWGIWGMVFGVPLIAVVRMVLNDYLDDGKINVSFGLKGKKEEATPETEENGG